LKIVLLSDLPPCKNYTAGLVLDQLCRFLPRGSIACFCVSAPELEAKTSSDLDWIPTEYRNRPLEAISLFKRYPLVHGLLNLGLHNYNRIAVRRLVSQAIKYARNFGADTLWCPLQGETQIRLALPVAQSLRITLLVQIYDHPTWILRGNSTPSFLQAQILKMFSKVVTNCRACATASWPMAKEYNEQFHVKTVSFLPSLHRGLAVDPAEKINSGQELVIGLAGQMYATKEWEALLRALDMVGWRISNRNVRIRLLGRWPRLTSTTPLRLEWLGWHTQQNTIRLLSETDILYCPYWFDSVFETEARLSFPSKLTTYFAAGRPVLFHGPQYAAPAVFLKDNDAGLICDSNDESKILKALNTLVSDERMYHRLTCNGRAAFDKYLTLENLRTSFAQFLQVEENYLNPVT
jgi:glycosyltransferase involved in cell wall biosynthesis